MTQHDPARTGDATPGQPYGQAPYPATGPERPVGTPAVAPKPVVTAARLIWALVALNVIGLITAFATKNALVDQLRTSNTGLTDSQLNTLATTTITIGVVFGLLFAALFAWLATQLPKGKNWARIVLAVLLALGLISNLTSLVGNATTLTKVIAVVSAVIQLAALVLLFGKASNEFFASRRTA